MGEACGAHPIAECESRATRIKLERAPSPEPAGGHARTTRHPLIAGGSAVTPPGGRSALGVAVPLPLPLTNSFREVLFDLLPLDRTPLGHRLLLRVRKVSDRPSHLLWLER